MSQRKRQSWRCARGLAGRAGGGGPDAEHRLGQAPPAQRGQPLVVVDRAKYLPQGRDRQEQAFQGEVVVGERVVEDVLVIVALVPVGRVPMDVLLDEKDEEYMAEWDAADAEALAAIGELLDQVGDRPLPAADLQAAAGRLREHIARPGWPGQLLVECGGMRPENLPADDAELWLRLAAGVASPEGLEEWSVPDEAEGELSETDSAIAAICAIDHFDWLAVITALAEGGPGTSASAADLAGYVRDYDPDGAELDGDDEDEDDYDLADLDEDAEFDELGMEGLFLPVTSLWQVMGAIDDDDCLTPLGWWGLPEAMRRVWAPS